MCVKNFVTGAGAMIYLLIKLEDGVKEEECVAGVWCVHLDFIAALIVLIYLFLFKLVSYFLFLVASCRRNW